MLDLLTGLCFYCLLCVVGFWSDFRSEGFIIEEEELRYREAIMIHFSVLLPLSKLILSFMDCWLNLDSTSSASTQP